MFKLWVKDTIANNTSLCPLTTMNTPRNFSRRLFIGGRVNCIIVRKPYQYFVKVPADTTRLQSRFSISANLQFTNIKGVQPSCIR